MPLIGPSTFQVMTILLTIGTAACVKIYHEHKSMEGFTSSLSTLSEHDLKTERTMCARLCNRNGKCASYFENSETKECYLVGSVLDADSGDLAKAPGWRYYARADCDTEKGYVFYTEISFCIKYFGDRITMPAAKNRCAQDGGRMVEIRNQRQQLALVKYLGYGGPIYDILKGSVELDDKYGPTIGGRRADRDSAWLFDDGTPLTYFNWKPDIITRNNCIKINPGKNCEWSPAQCDRKEPFVCQMP